MGYNTELREGDRFDEAVSTLIEAHRDEVHQLRKAVSVLAFVPDYLGAEGVGDDAFDQEFRAKQQETIRIAKLYADESLLRVAVDDLIGVLQEGLA